METNLTNSDLIGTLDTTSHQQPCSCKVSGHFVTDCRDIILEVLQSNRKELQTGKKIFLKKSIVNELINKGILKRNTKTAPANNVATHSSLLEDGSSRTQVELLNERDKSAETSMDFQKQKSLLQSKSVVPNNPKYSLQRHKAKTIRSVLKISPSQKLRSSSRFDAREISYSLRKLRSLRRMGESVKRSCTFSKRRKLKAESSVSGLKLIKGKNKRRKVGRVKKPREEVAKQEITHLMLDGSETKKISNDISNNEAKISEEKFKVCKAIRGNRNIILGKRIKGGSLSETKDKNLTKKRKIKNVSPKKETKHETVKCKKCWVLLMRLDDVCHNRVPPKDTTDNHESVIGVSGSIPENDETWIKNSSSNDLQNLSDSIDGGKKLNKKDVELNLEIKSKQKIQNKIYKTKKSDKDDNEKVSKHEEILNWIDKSVLPPERNEKDVLISPLQEDTASNVADALGTETEFGGNMHKLKENSSGKVKNKIGKNTSRDFKRKLNKKIKKVLKKGTSGKNLAESNSKENGPSDNRELTSDTDPNVASISRDHVEPSKDGHIQNPPTNLDRENDSESPSTKFDSPTLKQQIQKKLNVFGIRLKDVCSYFDVRHFISWNKSNPDGLLSIKRLPDATSESRQKFCFMIIEADKK